MFGGGADVAGGAVHDDDAEFGGCGNVCRVGELVEVD